MGQITSLTTYLREIADKPFRLGRHDCLTFSNEAWRRMYGVGWADDWVGRYISARNADDLRTIFGHETLAEAVDTRLTRCVGIPPRCALVTGVEAGGWLTGRSFGICVGTHAAFLSRSGVVYLPIDTIDNAWVPR